jgi:hypothetical protein
MYRNITVSLKAVRYLSLAAVAAFWAAVSAYAALPEGAPPDKGMKQQIEAEAAVRAEGDAALQSQIDAQAFAGSAGDATLQSAIEAEAAARAKGDTSMLDVVQGQLDSCQEQLDEQQTQLGSCQEQLDAQQDQICEIYELLGQLLPLECDGPTKPDLVVTDIIFDPAIPVYIYVEYMNIGAAGEGDFLIKISANEQSFPGNSYYRFPVPQPGDVERTGGFTIGLIGLQQGDTAEITAEIDWEGRVDESNENNNVLTKTVTLAP